MKTDSRGNPDVCRIEYTPVSDDAKVMIVALKLTANQIIADLTKIIHINRSVEIKRLCAIAINNMEQGTVMAVKALTSEGLVVWDERPGQNQGNTPTPK